MKNNFPIGKKKLIFITEAGQRLGLGHLMRCIGVAQEARRLGIEPFFFVNGSRITSSILKEYKFNFKNIRNVENIKDAPVLIDSKKDVSRLTSALQANGCMVTLMDNNTNAKFFPLRNELRTIRMRRINKKNNILISFGGSDPNALTLKVLRALRNVSQRLNIKVLIGPAFKKSHQDKIHKIAASYLHKIAVLHNHSNFKNLLKGIGLCITALGISVYEFNYFGIPVVLLCNYKKDERDAKVLRRLHIAESLGYYRDINLCEMGGRINKILNQGEIKINKYVDGKGAARILEKTLGQGIG